MYWRKLKPTKAGNYYKEGKLIKHSTFLYDVKVDGVDCQLYEGESHIEVKNDRVTRLINKNYNLNARFIQKSGQDFVRFSPHSEKHISN